MKKILLNSIFAFAITGALVSCKQDSALTENPMLPMSTTTTTAANPAIVYVATPLINNQNYYAIYVEDTDGTNRTKVETAASNSNSESFQNPSWNSSGSSIAYRDIAGSSHKIKAFDISVNSSGVPVATNLRTIYSLGASDSAVIQSGAAWSSKSSTAKIAFTRNHLGSKLGLSELCTISESGGAVTVLASYQKLNAQGYAAAHFLSPTWSPDDSKIAVIRPDSNVTYTGQMIMIYDASTGAALDSIHVTGDAASLEWSRTGTNQLVYSYAANASTSRQIYYVTPTTGSTPTTNSVVGSYPTWSPNNSGIMYINAALKKVVAYTSTTSTINSSPGGGSLNWKK